MVKHHLRSHIPHVCKMVCDRRFDERGKLACDRMWMMVLRQQEPQRTEEQERPLKSNCIKQEYLELISIAMIYLHIECFS